MSIFIVPDIFGRTKTITSLAATLANSQIIDPYPITRRPQSTDSSNQSPPFANEDEAYQHFIDNCGHQHYYQQVLAAIKQNPDSHIIAFSAGASAAFRAISEIPVKHLIGFYPSQIRHHLELQPSCPTTLIFPSHEPHFALSKVIKTVAEWPMVSCLQSKAQHGFMNPLSKGFDQVLANQISQVLQYSDLNNIAQIQQLLRDRVHYER